MYQVHHVHMSDILIFVFWKMIDSYQDAQLLYSIFKAKQCRWKIALQDAQAGLQQAQKKFKCARKRLTKAEFRLGRTRNMVKNSGFSNVLQKKVGSVRLRPTVKVYGMYVSPCYIESFSQPMPLRKSLNRNTWSPLRCKFELI